MIVFLVQTVSVWYFQVCTWITCVLGEIVVLQTTSCQVLHSVDAVACVLQDMLQLKYGAWNEGIRTNDRD